MPRDRPVTALLAQVTEGDKDAREKLMPIVYDELKRRAASLMKRESPRHTLQATALVHEAYIKLVGHDRIDWQNRTQFFAVASQIMRRILVDHARGRQREKRGGPDAIRISIDDGLGLSTESDADVLAVDDAIIQLAKDDPRQAEIVVMRFFGGLTVEEVAAALDVSKRTIEGEWTMIKAWLRRELEER